MRATLLLTTSLLLSPGLAHAVERMDLEGGAPEELAPPLMGRSWSCQESTLDTTNRRGLGMVVCLTNLAVVPETGTALATFEVAVNRNRPFDPEELRFELELRGEERRRELELYDVGPASGALEHTPTEDAEYATFDLVFAFEVFDERGVYEELRLKLAGSGQARWQLGPELALAAPSQGPRPLALPPQMADARCRWDEVRPAQTRGLNRYVEDNLLQQPLHLAFSAATDDSAEFDLYLPGPKTAFVFNEGTLHIRGAERFRQELPDWSEDPENPNQVELWYDGEDALLRVNRAIYGPFFAARRVPDEDDTRFELTIETRPTRIRNLVIDGCVQEQSEEPVALAEADSAPPAREEPPADEGGEEQARVRRRGPSPLEVLGAVQQGVAAGMAVGRFADTAGRAAHDANTFSQTGGFDGRGLMSEDGSSMSMMGGHAGVSDDGQVNVSLSDMQGNTVSSGGMVGADGSVDAGISATGPDIGSGQNAAAQPVELLGAADWPAGATLEIDGRPQPMANGRGRVMLAPGPHTLRLLSGAQVLWSGTLQVGNGPARLSLSAGGVQVEGARWSGR